MTKLIRVWQNYYCYNFASFKHAAQAGSMSWKKINKQYYSHCHLSLEKLTDPGYCLERIYSICFSFSQTSKRHESTSKMKSQLLLCIQAVQEWLQCKKVDQVNIHMTFASLKFHSNRQWTQIRFPELWKKKHWDPRRTCRLYNVYTLECQLLSLNSINKWSTNLSSFQTTKTIPTK